MARDMCGARMGNWRWWWFPPYMTEVRFQRCPVGGELAGSRAGGQIGREDEAGAKKTKRTADAP